jgi:nucleoside-diphosphate-sugar epimerase
LKITRVAVASSINVFPLAYSLDENMKYDYFPVDEKHPNRIDEPYGLSKVIGELQASSLCARYPFLRIASLRIHWSVPSLEEAQAQSDPHEDNTRKELWGWIQEDEGARAFWLGLTVGDSDSEFRGASGAGQGGRGWKGHEVFNIAAPTTRCPQVGSETLRQKYFPNVPVREGVFKVEGRNGFFDCSKAERMLGWVHK